MLQNGRVELRLTAEIFFRPYSERVRLQLAVAPQATFEVGNSSCETVLHQAPSVYEIENLC